MIRFTIVAILCATSACGPTIISPGAADLTSGIREFPVPDVILDTPPVTTPQDVNFAGLINGLRMDDGLADVAFDARLDQAAQKHAQDMVDNDYFNHISQDGRTPEQRIIAEGYTPVISGENIASVQQTDQGVLDAWISSPSHNALMRRDDVEDFALGVAGQGRNTRWVLLLATERE